MLFTGKLHGKSGTSLVVGYWFSLFLYTGGQSNGTPSQSDADSTNTTVSFSAFY